MSKRRGGRAGPAWPGCCLDKETLDAHTEPEARTRALLLRLLLLSFSEVSGELGVVLLAALPPPPSSARCALVEDDSTLLPQYRSQEGRKAERRVEV